MPCPLHANKMQKKREGTCMRVRRFIASLLLLLFTGNVCAFALPRTNQETPSFKILSLRHESAGATTRIILETSAPPLYAVFRPTENQVVVELPEADSANLQPSYVVKSAVVD